MKYDDPKRLDDRQLLARTAELVQQERDHTVAIIHHLREIRARGLHLARGFPSLFQYVVKALHYSDGAAYRRLQTLKLLSDCPELEEELRRGTLNLTTAAMLQTGIDKGRRLSRVERGRARPPGADGSSPVAGAALRSGSLWEAVPPPREAGPAAAVAAGQAPPPRAAGTAHATHPAAASSTRRQAQSASRPQASSPSVTAPPGVIDYRDLVQEAKGRSSREVARLIADLDPQGHLPRERLRSLGGGRWELRAVVDDSCHAGLDQLRALLSHIDPALSYGALLTRLVADALKKYDPCRQTGRTAATSDAGTACKPAPRQRAARQRPARKSPAAASSAGSAANSTADRRPTSAQKPGTAVAAHRTSASGSEQATTAAQKPAASAPTAGSTVPTPNASPTTTGAGRAPAGPASQHGAQNSCSPAGAAPSLADPARRHGHGFARDSSPAAGAVGAAPQPADPAPQQPLTSAQKSRPTARATPPADPAPQHPPTSAQKSCPTRSSDGVVVVRRAIPVAVRRYVWRRDGGACRFIDPETGQQCGSRHLLQIDHIQPFAMGGANTADNLQLACGAHNRFRARRSFGTHPAGAATGCS